MSEGVDYKMGRSYEIMVPCPDNQHEWEEGYYGTTCKKCSTFYAYGCAPWDEEQEQPDSDFCPNCGRELGDISDYGCWYCDPASFPVMP